MPPRKRKSPPPPSPPDSSPPTLLIRLVSLLILLVAATVAYQNPASVPTSFSDLQIRTRFALDRLESSIAPFRNEFSRWRSLLLNKLEGVSATDAAQKEQDEADEILGRVWAASKASRQAAKPYNIKGDGTSSSDQGAAVDVEGLEEADPLAKSGIDAETWERIKGELSGDDLAQMLDAVRRSEL